MSESRIVLEQARADADRLAETRIVGKWQAMAFALLDICGIERKEAAVMDTSRSNSDNLLADARSHIGSAHDVMAIVGARPDK